METASWLAGEETDFAARSKCDVKKTVENRENEAKARMRR